MAISNLFFFLKMFKQKREASEIIINAEIMSYYTGLHSFDVIQKMYQRMRGNQYLRRVIQEYQKEKPRSEIYRDVLDKELIYFLRMAEEKHTVVSEIFKDYQEIKEKVMKANGKIRGAIMRPFMMYFLASIVVFYSFTNILNQTKGIKGLNVETLQMLHTWFWPLIVLIAFVIVFPLIKFPHAIPLLRGAWKELKAFQYLSFVKFMLSMGLSTVDVIELFRKVLRVDVKKQGIEGLVEFFRRYLRPEEVVVLELAGETYEYERVINSLLEKRKVEFEKRIEMVVGALGEVLNFLVLIPVFLMLYALFTLMLGASNVVAG